jgi:hypothetical protein
MYYDSSQYAGAKGECAMRNIGTFIFAAWSIAETIIFFLNAIPFVGSIFALFLQALVDLAQIFTNPMLDTGQKVAMCTLFICFIAAPTFAMLLPALSAFAPLFCGILIAGMLLFALCSTLLLNSTMSSIERRIRFYSEIWDCIFLKNRIINNMGMKIIIGLIYS